MRLKIRRKIETKEQTTNDEIINLLLKDRGITDINSFLKPPHPTNISFDELFLRRPFEKLVKKLDEIKKKNAMIVVYTDYDADGITGGAILWETLHLLGFKAMPYVPQRKHEGYGFSQTGIDAVQKLYQPALIISVDHGISAASQISYAKKLGIPVIVSDHHLKPNCLPTDALAIFHNEKLSGSGVAYFLAKEIFKHFSSHLSAADELKNNLKEDYLALASIGTIADLVPLVGPSRGIVKHGLTVFSQVRRVGLRQILQEAGIAGRPISPYEVGFIIAPRINAVGRLTHAIDALRLLCTRRISRAFALAQKVGHMNRQRQDLVEKALAEARSQVENSSFLKTSAGKQKSQIKSHKLIILISHTWHEGIIGLIAAKIAEQFYRPTIVLTVVDGFAKASARSIPGFDITSFLRSHKADLVSVGGHKAAAGFTIEKEKVDDFVAKIRRTVGKKLSEKALVPTTLVDLQLPLSRLTVSLVKALDKLAPFGVGNPQPVFYSEGELRQASLFGKQKTHLKIQLQSGFEVNFFGKSAEFFQLARGQKLGVAYSLEIDRWTAVEKVRGKGRLIKILT